jgi:8-hydroxy-5-deazaflavin:NADPH oxidoreductase
VTGRLPTGRPVRPPTRPSECRIARQLATGGETLRLSSAGVIDEIADSLADKLVVVPSNPLITDAHGNIVRVLPEGQPSGKVVAGWLPTGARLAMAFGTPPAGPFESASNRSPEPAVLFYVADDDRAGQEVERLIRTAGFEPVRAGGIGQSGRLEVGGDLHGPVVGLAEARSLISGA